MLIKLTGLICIGFLFSCSSGGPFASRSHTFGEHFSKDEQRDMLISRVNANFETAKRNRDREALLKARDSFEFLVSEYGHDASQKKVAEVDSFFVQYRRYYDELIESALKKNLLFTAGGYYQRILELFPEDTTAQFYIQRNKDELNKRLTRNMSAGFTYIKQNKFNAAKRCFNRILRYDPDNLEAVKGLKDVKRKRTRLAILARQKAAASRKQKAEAARLAKLADKVDATEPELTDTEKAKLYQQAIKAYESKDYLKAYDFFEAINDTTFKDTQLYINRSEDKIDALGLSEDDDDN